jgi:nucleotide-binding universal stress UspA family protein
MIKRIVVPLDGSKLAEMALPHAVAVALANNFGLTLLRVAVSSAPITTAPWGAVPPPNAWDDWVEEEREGHNYLQSVAERLHPFGFDVHTLMMENESGPASGIISYVEQHPEVTLIAMSTHGKSGLTRWVFGSVAEKVLHASPIPLLLVRSTQDDELPDMITPADYRSLLVPLDGSVFAEQALDIAGDLAGVLKAKVTLVSAIPDLPLATELVAPPAVVVPVTDETSILANYLAENRGKLLAKGLTVETKLEYGPPAEAILRVGDVVDADLIVMATHGRTGLPRLWLGSIAMKVVQASSLPVLLIRSKERVQEAEPAFAGAGAASVQDF